MNRFARTLLVGLTAVGLLLAASPANAGAPLTWEDPAGDATDMAVGVDVFPNEAAMDLTTIKFSADGSTLKLEASVPEMTEGSPSPAWGYYLRFYFTVDGGSQFHFRLGEGITGPVFSFRDPANAVVECKGCTGKVDRESKTAIITAPYAGLAAGFKAADLGDPAGNTVVAAEVWTQRFVADNATLTADTAIAPEGSSLAL